MKIGSMSFEDLVKTKARLEAEIEVRVANERRQLLSAMSRLNSAKAGRAGPALSSPMKGKKLPPLYRNPTNRQETWAGRGLKPRWLVAALKSGKKLEAFAIK